MGKAFLQSTRDSPRVGTVPTRSHRNGLGAFFVRMINSFADGALDPLRRLLLSKDPGTSLESSRYGERLGVRIPALQPAPQTA